MTLLYDIALARSGDKGADSNLVIWTDSDARYEYLRGLLTPEVVKDHLKELVHGPVERYELPHLRALNFILHDALDGGGAESLRSDAQGKVYGLALLQLDADIPSELLA